MKKISLLVILLLLPLSYVSAATDKESSYTAEFEKLLKKYPKYNSDFKCKHEFQSCADKGNYYCSMVVGAINYEEKKYGDALRNFKQCSGMINGKCDHMLGLIYDNGLGVMQNDEKAISYYEEAANLGDSASAYNLSIIYSNKKPSKYSSYKYSSEGTEEYATYSILEYAWIKVAMALGQEHYYTKNDEKLPISQLFEIQKESMASDGLLQKGDKMANQICSRNEFCGK